MIAKAKNTEDKVVERRANILTAARWCFLNFGYAKTSFEDIAKRANLSRTLLYRIFKDKEDIYTAVFTEWLIARHPSAQQAAVADGAPYERLVNVCRLMVLEPWSDMVGAPMGGEFFDVCGKIDPDIEAHHRRVAFECIAAVLGDKERSEVFLLSLDGLLSDNPPVAVLERRLQILAELFVQSAT